MKPLDQPDTLGCSGAGEALRGVGMFLYTAYPGKTLLTLTSRQIFSPARQRLNCLSNHAPQCWKTRDRLKNVASVVTLND